MSVVSPTLSPGATLPMGWGYHGCWTDYGRRKLSGPSYVDSENMTPASCIEFCNNKRYPFAGVELGQECYCGYVIGAGSEKKNDTECDFICPGALGEACGAGFRLNVFYNRLLDYAHTNPGPPGTSRMGCLTDDIYARALSVLQASEDGLTVAQCTSSCKAAGHTLAGLEFGRECFCGDTIDNNATTTEEGCDMPCTGDRTEFCGGADRLDLYILNETSTSPTSTVSATQTCNPTSKAAANQLIANGGFEHGLANWTAEAYDPNRAPFDVGFTDDAFEGCSALSVVPKNGGNAQGHHFYARTTLANLRPSSQYRVSLAIGHPNVVDPQGSDPWYAIRLSDSALGSGPVCGFKNSSCQSSGSNRSKYEILNMTFTANCSTGDLIIYLSWYNGNFDTPIYLDRVTIEPLFGTAPTSMAASDSSLQLSTAASLAAGTVVPSSTTKTTLTTMTSAVDAKVSKSSKEALLPSRSGVSGVLAPSASSTFQACPRSLPRDKWQDNTRPNITSKSLPNSGFERGFKDWWFSPEGGTFDISLTNQSIEGCLAASIKPTSPHNGIDRSLTVQTRLINLNSSHEWYEMAIYIGHANTNTTANNDLSPSLRISYRNEVSGDLSRTGGLCGFARTPTYDEKGWPCEYTGVDGTVWAHYGMDTRLFLGGERLTNATEMDIELKFVWPEGASEVPVLMDGMRIWEIEWGTISR